MLGGCGSLSGAVRTDSALLAESSRPASIEAPSGAEFESADLLAADAELDPGEAVLSFGVGAPDDGASAMPMIAQAERAPADKPEPAPAEKLEPDGEEEYDPLEKFNEVMFEVNRQLDRLVLKPVAQVYRVIVPEPFEIMIANGFDNIAFVPRAGEQPAPGQVGRYRARARHGS